MIVIELFKWLFYGVAVFNVVGIASLLFYVIIRLGEHYSK